MKSFFLVNIALGKPTKQSTTGYGGKSSRAVDGNKDGNFYHYSCTHTEWESKTSPWWRVDLGQSSKVAQVKIVNREDCCSGRLSNFDIRVGNVDDNPDANAV